MNKRLRSSIIVICLIMIVGGLYAYNKIRGKVVRLTPEVQKELNLAVSKENESAITKPSFRPRNIQGANPLKNVYFGDTHTHTSLSFDSYLSGTRFSLEDAYKFAQGEQVQLFSGEIAQLSEPLDFVAITDHAESFGLFEGCASKNLNAKQKDFCGQFDDPSLSTLFKLKKEVVKRPPKAPADLCLEDGSFCREHGRTTWLKTQQAAKDAYIPGLFTTFYSFEYSPVWKDLGSTHRNVYFRNTQVPDNVVSAFDASTAIELWKILESTCTQNCEFLTIPHNLNRYQGKAYSSVDEDGKPYTKEDWQSRQRNEPLAEIYQAKGNSECAVAVNTADEECNFEQLFLPCEGDEKGRCASDGSFARDGLKFGLTLEDELGFNPLRFGFIGSTDTHNATPGDTEEWDYRGKLGVRDQTAVKRLAEPSLIPGNIFGYNPGGLAAIWAPENTREALFDAMKSKETYATSGTRIRLRFFGSWTLNKQALNQENLIKDAYEIGVPMGGVLKANRQQQKPNFLVWAVKDPIGANLDRIQMVKGWVENGKIKEEVFDIACSDGASPSSETGKCPDNGARVKLDTCEVSANVGDKEIKVLWTDENFKAEDSSFYYVRVLQNPTCRWSSYDAIRLNVAPPKEISAVLKERAWSSPIWYSPNN
ncbi:MAG: DUF3604 domain-containing protein [Colwellia sp.]|nr:DUF3604 domain-containing protein [Colwellia sp.]MCW9081172.1 DUF3604 domain-containing protein [Colwellia sp.]